MNAQALLKILGNILMVHCFYKELPYRQNKNREQMIKLIRNIKWFGIFMANQFILTVGICTFVKYTRKLFNLLFYSLDQNVSKRKGNTGHSLLALPLCSCMSLPISLNYSSSTPCLSDIYCYSKSLRPWPI